MKHKVLLLGLGFWGSRWLKLILKTECSELAGVAGSGKELEQVRSLYKIDPSITFTDFREAIAKTDAEIAVVVLPGVLHLEADSLALKKGMHVITEKPLAMNLDEADTLMELKAKYPQQQFMASQNYRWRPYNQAMRQAVKSGMIGKTESVLLEFRQQEDLQGYRAGLSMPLLQDVSIHHFDLLRFFTGADCRSVYCQTWRPSWSLFEGKPNAEAILHMDPDITVIYTGSWAARGKETSWDGNFTITGDRGCLTLDSDNRVFFYEHRKAESVAIETASQKGVEVPQPRMQYTEMEYGFRMFMDCIEKGTVPETTVEDNYKSFQMVMAAQRSAMIGKKVVFM
jgi:predicted dehydrogenase